MAVTTHTLGPGVLELGDMLADGIAVECQIKESRLTPDTDEGDTDTTLCGDTVSGEDTTTWKIEGELFQDWTATGINRYSVDNMGQEVDFRFVPRTADVLEITGKLKMRPLPIGGATKQKLTAEFEWPVVGAPVFTWPS